MLKCTICEQEVQDLSLLEYKLCRACLSERTTEQTRTLYLENRKNRLETYDLINCPICKWDIPKDARNWCQNCAPKLFQDQFSKWTSKNPTLDGYIQESQKNSTHWYDPIEWIEFEQFTNIRTLGEGGFANVYAATWRDGPIMDFNPYTREWKRYGPLDVALKILKPGFKEEEIVYNEIRVNANKTVNFLYRLWGISRDPKTKTLVLAFYYFESGTLRDNIHRSYYSEQSSWVKRAETIEFIMYQINLIHGENILHHDLHTANILGECGQPKIADYGMGLMGNTIKDTQSDGDVFGVLPFVAPEVLNKKPYTKESEWYAFGMIAYEIVTGRLPFDDRAHDVSLAIQICSGERPVIADDIPSYVAKFIRSFWNDDPQKRANYNTAIHQIREIKEKLRELNPPLPKRFLPSAANPQTRSHPKAIFTSRRLSLPSEVIDSKLIDLTLPDNEV